MVSRFTSSEKASPLMLRAYRPFSWANFSKAAELYQPAVPGLLAARTLEEHPEGIGAGTERGGDAGSQAIAGGGTDDQDLLRSVDDGALGLDVVDLLLDVGLAACRMGSDADEATHARFDDHENLGC